VRRALLVLVLAVAALAGAVAVRPPHAPPLYDGLGFPDEPYRWVAPPAGADKTPQPPTAASASIAVDAGVSVPVQGFSEEQGPQIAFAVGSGALAAPAGVAAVTLLATPAAAPPPPAKADVVSNLYTISARAGTTPVTLAKGAQLVVNLRADAATKQAVVVCLREGGRWVQLPTRQVGTEIYAARLDRLGAVALLRLAPGVQPSAVPSDTPSSVAGAVPQATSGAGPVTDAAGDGPGAGVLWLSIGAVLVLIAAVLLLLRRRVARDADPDPEADDAAA
jgi:hypothetical protein